MNTKRGFHHGDLKNAVLEEGLRLINEIGYKNLELKDIAKACGVSSPSIYRHFRDKDELMYVLQIKVSEFFYEYLLANECMSSPEEKIVSMGVSFIKFSRDYKYYFEFLFNSKFNTKVVVSGQDAKLDMMNNNSFSLFKNVVQNYFESKGIKGNIGMHVVNLWAYISGMATVSSSLTYIEKEKLLESYVKEMLLIYTNGILNTEK